MRLLAIVVALSSFSAFACPDLAGTYATCRSTTGSIGGSTDMVVTQRIENGVTIYTATSTDDDTQERKSEEMTADGITRSETTNDPEFGEVSASITFTCSGPKVIGNMSMIAQGQALINIDQQVQKNGSALEIDYSGSIFGMEFTDTLVCE